MTKKIETPAGQIVTTRTKNGKYTTKLTWNAGFGPEQTTRYTQAQKFMDSEVLRRSDPFVPMKTGMLKKSGTLGTDIGSGEVKWIAPYAHAQYYRKGSIGSQTGANRGPYWFERMKSAFGKAIIAGVKKIAGGKT